MSAVVDPDERRFWRWASRNQTCPQAEGVEGHCWIWSGARTRGKQPLIWMTGKTVSAVVWLYERQHGPRPPGTQLSPRCGRSMCVRPSHREVRPRGSHIRKKAA